MRLLSLAVLLLSVNLVKAKKKWKKLKKECERFNKIAEFVVDGTWSCDKGECSLNCTSGIPVVAAGDEYFNDVLDCQDDREILQKLAALGDSVEIGCVPDQPALKYIEPERQTTPLQGYFGESASVSRSASWNIDTGTEYMFHHIMHDMRIFSSLNFDASGIPSDFHLILSPTCHQTYMNVFNRF